MKLFRSAKSDPSYGESFFLIRSMPHYVVDNLGNDFCAFMTEFLSRSSEHIPAEARVLYRDGIMFAAPYGQRDGVPLVEVGYLKKYIREGDLVSYFATLGVEAELVPPPEKRPSCWRPF